jgi:Txe/YoeB family toxin of Txe-Axe toxin-antitoxin module
VDWKGILLTAGASALFTGILAFLFQSWIGELFSKRLDRFRKDLQRDAFEHETRFSQLHKRRFDVIEELFRRLARAKRALDLMVAPVEPHDVTKRERIKTASESVKACSEYFDETRYYFPKDICRKLEDLFQKFHEISIEFYSSQEQKSQSAEYVESWKEAENKMKHQVSELLQEIEEEMRRMISYEGLATDSAS